MYNKERMDKQFEFIREIDKEKLIRRQTYLSTGERKENDAEHAWHMAVMTLLLSEYANEEIDVLKTIAMILIHDVVEIDAGDTYAYGNADAKASQRAREEKAAERLFNLLPEDQAKRFRDLWEEFEARETPESKFANSMDNIQPTVLNAASDGKSWAEHEVTLDKVMTRQSYTPNGSRELWEYSYENFIMPNVEKGRIKE